jgi:predicted nucleic acid-binding protein
MTIGSSSPVFLDTNVLVYASERQASLHQQALNAINAFYNTGIPLWISRQVMREYIATLTRPQMFANPQPIARLVADVRQFENRFHVAEDGPYVTQVLLALVQQIPTGGKQIHDANIVATMQAHGIIRLFTHNTADFARFSAHITVVPLV